MEGPVTDRWFLMAREITRNAVFYYRDRHAHRLEPSRIDVTIWDDRMIVLEAQCRWENPRTGDGRSLSMALKAPWSLVGSFREMESALSRQAMAAITADLRKAGLDLTPDALFRKARTVHGGQGVEL